MIANALKRQRIRKKLSQEKLARLADVSYNTIVKIETGSTSNPGIRTISKIAKALGVTVDELINPVRNTKNLTKNGIKKRLRGLEREEDVLRREAEDETREIKRNQK